MESLSNESIQPNPQPPPKMPLLPPNQRAIVQPDKNSTDVVMVTDHPVPEIDKAAGEHLIRVRTTAITKGELLWSRDFPLPADLAAQKTLVPCDDVAGYVLDGPASSPFQRGAEVYARSNYRRAGCAREYTVLLTDEMSQRPGRLSWAQSAAVPMSAETAWQALFVHANLTPRQGSSTGKTILVTAASGGVGVWMTQLGKWAGATVIATCGTGSVARLRALGADEVLDYTKTSVQEWLGGRSVDVVLDCIGSKGLADAWYAVRGGGTVISIVQSPASVRPPKLSESLVRDLFFVMEPDGQQLQQVTRLIEEAGLEPSVDSTFSFERFHDAFARVGGGKASGKVVIEVW